MRAEKRLGGTYRYPNWAELADFLTVNWHAMRRFVDNARCARCGHAVSAHGEDRSGVYCCECGAGVPGEEARCELALSAYAERKLTAMLVAAKLTAGD